jgi:hypothetical protein
VANQKVFIVITILYISKKYNYELSCKSDLTVTYCFGHSTCNSGPFLFKIGANEAYSQGVHRSNLNRFGLVFSWKCWTATESPVFSGPVQSQSGLFPVLWTGLLNTKGMHYCTWPNGPCTASGVYKQPQNGCSFPRAHSNVK